MHICTCACCCLVKKHVFVKLTFFDLAPTPQNGQTLSNKLSALADELLKCV